MAMRSRGLAGVLVVLALLVGVLAAAPAQAATPATIMQIQGIGFTSPLEGLTVTTTGVVTAYTDDGRDMWIQDPTGDGNPFTSDGVFVDDANTLSPSPAIGDLIMITGEVEEQQFGVDQPKTRINNPTLDAIISSGNPLPRPVRLRDLPGVAIADGLAFWEAMEGMLVNVRKARVVAPTTRFGEFTMLTAIDAKPGSGYLKSARQIGLRQLKSGDVDYNPERILVDDATLPDPIFVNPGNMVNELTGIVDYSFGMYKLQPTSYGVTSWPVLAVGVSKRSKPAGDTAITTFNVENLFDLVDDPVKDDASSTPTPAELETKLDKLALAIQEELLLPEIMVLQEVENEDIAQVLGNRVNVAAGTGYVAVGFETSDARGIEVAFLYDADRVTLLSAFQLSGPAVEAAFGPTSPSPGREPIVGTFQIEGKTVTIIGNHFKSKSGDNPPFGVIQPFGRITEVQRKMQAQAVRDYVDTLLAADPLALVMVAGDLNDFEFAEPGEGADHTVGILEGATSSGPAMTNLVLFERRVDRWSFVFDGNSQVLDHMLVSPALLGLFKGGDFLHFNASYRFDIGDIALASVRSSDHDPFEGRFKFGS